MLLWEAASLLVASPLHQRAQNMEQLKLLIGCQIGCFQMTRAA
jgi:hypothetical protein